MYLGEDRMYVHYDRSHGFASSDLASIQFEMAQIAFMLNILQTSPIVLKDRTVFNVIGEKGEGGRVADV